MATIQELKIDSLDVYKDLYTGFIGPPLDGDLILKYFGRFNDEFIIGLSEELERVLIAREESPEVVRKMFSAVLEGMRNICLCSTNKNVKEKFGHILIKSDENGYLTSIGSVFPMDRALYLASFINEVNSMNHDELRSFYRQNEQFVTSLSRNNFKSGISTVALRLRSKIDYEFYKLKNTSICYFEMKMKCVV